MPRALLIVLDSVGIGGAEDAAAYGDAGADTLGHIAEACAAGGATGPSLREGPLHLPHMAALGLGLACEASTGRMPPNLAPQGKLKGAWGYGVETSKGKDTPSGHWEIAGVPVTFDWGYFPDTVPAFPKELTAAFIERGNLPGILADKHASGTTVIDEYGAEHMRTGKPIFYTSVDSVLQIAAHEETFGLERLYELCRIGRELCDAYKIGRVIARPFIGSPETGFKRTGNRKDFAMPPPADTILDTLTKAGRSVVTVGKIGDIFAHRSHGPGDQAQRQRCLPVGCRRGAEGSARRRLRLRQSRRFRQRVRPPPRHPRLCRRARGLRPAHSGDRGGASGRRPRHHHRRPRQRPLLARHRPYPRARADPELRTRRAAGRHRAAGELCRYRSERAGSFGRAPWRQGSLVALGAPIAQAASRNGPGSSFARRLMVICR